MEHKERPFEICDVSICTELWKLDKSGVTTLEYIVCSRLYRIFRFNLLHVLGNLGLFTRLNRAFLLLGRELRELELNLLSGLSLNIHWMTGVWIRFTLADTSQSRVILTQWTFLTIRFPQLDFHFTVDYSLVGNFLWLFNSCVITGEYLISLIGTGNVTLIVMGWTEQSGHGHPFDVLTISYSVIHVRPISFPPDNEKMNFYICICWPKSVWNR